jgi:hypothetical protein
MSKLETNTIDTVSGTTNLTIGSTNTSSITLGASGDTITVPNGALSGQNYPAFEASLSSAQNISDAIATKVQLDTEVFDTDNCYDNTTNYRFTPNVAGKYFVYAYARCQGSVSNRLLNIISYIYKNGSTYRVTRHNFNSSALENIFTVYNYTTIELNGSSDYVEFFLYGDTTSGFPIIHQSNTLFGAYRIGA